MNRIASLAALGAASLGIAVAVAQSGAAPKLAAQDLLDIRGLIDSYSHILDNCTNNGNDYANEYCWVYTCRDGKVWLLEEYADTLHAGRVFGWIKD